MFAKSIVTKGGDVFRDEYSLAFDGTNDNISIPETTYDVDGGTVSFTFWAKRDDISVQNIVMGNHHNYSFINLHSNANMYIESDTNDDLASAPITNDTNWHHYVITCNSGTVAMYEDGISLTMGDSSIGDDITISKISINTAKVFNGNISEVAIYNSALTANQVKTIYNGREPYNHKEGVASGNLQGWWRMGDGSLDDYALICDETNATLGSNLITSFTNGSTYAFDTFSTSGNNISSAIETSGNWGGAASNSLNLTAGEIYKCTFDLTYNSGDDTLRVLLVNSANGAATSVVDVVYYTNTNGSNVFYFKVKTTDSTSHLQLGTWHSSDVINFSATNITLQKVNGNAGYMFNMSATDIEGDTP